MQENVITAPRHRRGAVISTSSYTGIPTTYPLSRGISAHASFLYLAIGLTAFRYMNETYYWSYFFPMRKGIFDDDYYFYEDGRILHSYDKTQTKLNIEEFVSPESIDISKRQIMLSACPQDKYDTIKRILKL